MNDASDARGVEHREFLDLVREFSEKLRHACDAYYERRVTWSRHMSLALLTAIVVISSFGLYAKINQLTPMIERGDSTAVIGFMVTVICGFAVTYWIWQSRCDIHRSQFDIRPLVAALESLVSRASQLEDRSVRDADEKVVFVLRIAEAESALEYADWVTGSHSFWFPFGRTLVTSDRQYRSRSVSL